MKTLHDYESFQYIGNQPLTEVWSGVAIVQWYGNIERQVTRMLEEQEGSRNFPYADKLREFLKIWRENEVTGSLNRESLEILKTAADMLAVDAWNLNNYFSNLRDQLRKLVASEEQLPRVDMDQNDAARGPGGGAGRGSMPNMASEFGPEEKTPPGMGQEPPPDGGGEIPMPKGEVPPEDEEEDEEDKGPIVPGRRMPPPPRGGGGGGF